MMRVRLLSRLLLVTLALALFPVHPRSAGNTYYVATTGSNGVSCGTAQTIGTPKQTIVNALTCLSAGDTLLVRAGYYNEGLASAPSGTSWSNKVRIAAYPGDTVWLRPSSNATSAGGIGEIIWFDCNCHFIEFDGINFDGTFITGGVVWLSTNNGNDPHHIRFKNASVIAGAIGRGAAMLIGSESYIGATGSNELQNLTITGGGLPGLCGFECASYGVYLKGPNNLVENLDIYDTAGAGIQIYNGVATDRPNNNIVRNNRIHDISRTGSLDEVWGIIVVGSYNQIYNNLIYNITIGNPNPSNAGIAVGNGETGNKIWNNTIYNHKCSGIFVQVGATNTEVRNNIAFGNGCSQFLSLNNSTVQSNNLFGIDPGFVNASGGNFHLSSTSSPAYNTGMSLAQVSSDLAGVARPQGVGVDIGAYEYVVSGPVPAAPTGLHVVPQ